VLWADFATSKVSATTNILPVNHVTVIDATGAAATSMARGKPLCLCSALPELDCGAFTSFFE